MNPIWLFVALVIIVVIVIVVWAVWACNKKGKKKKWIEESAYAVATDIIEVATSVTGTASGASAFAETGFIDILSTTVNTCGKTNTLFAAVSAETVMGSIEENANTGSTMTINTSEEIAQITVRVLVDDVEISPGIVTFDRLFHSLTTNALPGDAKLELLTLSEANAFNFVAPNVKAGTHTIVVQAALEAMATAQVTNQADVFTIIGSRSLVVSPGYVGVPCSPKCCDPCAKPCCSPKCPKQCSPCD